MAIPSIICRGKNLHLATMKQFFAALPREPMPKGAFFDYAEKRMTGFKQTHSQIARQMALYYCDAQGVCHPRFCRELTLAEILSYSRYWAEHYFVPNPYTPSFPPSCSPTNVYAHVVANCNSCGGDFDQLLLSIFNLKLNEGDKAKSYLLQFTGIVEDANGKFVCDNLSAPDPNVDIDRSDEEAYFHYYDGWESSVINNAKGVSEVAQQILSLQELGEELSLAYNAAGNSEKVASLYAFVFRFGASIFGQSFNPLYTPQQLIGATNGAVNNSYVAEIGKAFRIIRYISKDVSLYEYLRLILGMTQHNRISGGDMLTPVLKMFAEKRKEEDWCSDKTDGDANKPRPGYIANKQLRVLSNTPADIGKLNGDAASNIKAWFKNYWNVADGKSWLNGLNDADLSGFGPYIVHLLQPNSPAVVRPDKFGNALEAAVKAVINPEETGMYDERVNEALKFLGLIGFGWNENFDADDLGEAVNAQRIIKRRLKDMGVKRIQESPTSDDGNAPDYLTVNEFLWFVKLNLNRIEKEVQEGKMKPATHKAIEQKQKDKKPKVDIKDSEDVLMLRLRAALRTKPFAILAGHSGTGKSRMVRKLAYMTCNDNALRYALDDAGNIKKDEHGNGIFLKEPGNFCMVQVKPNWHDSSDLLGYYSELGKRYRSTDFIEFICKAYAYPNTPFFVCLDEMNLAPVEQYFAEYLSAIEGRKLTSEGVLTTDELIAKSAYTKEDATGKSVMYEWLGCTMTESRQWLETYGLTIPRNLFVVGTVNMDETTNQFSRKVLDRAMTIEMTDADFDSFGAKPSELKFDDEYMGDDAVKEMLSGEVQAKTLTTDQKNNLNALKAVLAPTSFAVAYRFANEYALYEESLTKTVDSSVKPNPPGTLEEVLTLPDPSSAAATAVPATASPEAAETVSAAEAAPAAEGETAEGTAASATTKKKDPAIPSAFDDMVLMKVLPRISGDEADVKQIFYEGRVVGKKGTRENPADKTLMKILDVSKDTESLRKIAAILDRGGTYLSFWP